MWRQLAAALVMAALQYVLHLQLQPRAQQVEPDEFVGGRRNIGEPPDEFVDVGSPVHFPGVGMRETERTRRLRPQRAMRDPARYARFGPRHCRRVVQPAVEFGPTRAEPVPGVQRAESPAGNPVAAAVDAAPLVGLQPMPPGIGGRGEDVQVRAGCVDPPQPMSLTQSLPAGVPFASGHPAAAGAEHRVIGVEFQHVAAEFVADRHHQRAQQAHCLAARRPSRRRHSDTCPSVNQPACSITRRASSTVRCP